MRLNPWTMKGENEMNILAHLALNSQIDAENLDKLKITDWM